MRGEREGNSQTRGYKLEREGGREGWGGHDIEEGNSGKERSASMWRGQGRVQFIERIFRGMLSPQCHGNIHSSISVPFKSPFRRVMGNRGEEERVNGASAAAQPPKYCAACLIW